MYSMEKVKLALLCMQRHSWEQGVTTQAFLECGDEDTVIALSKESAYRRIADGRPAMIRENEGITDPCSVGEAMLYAYEKTGDADLGAALEALRVWAFEKAPRNSRGIVYHVPYAPQVWVDSFYMFPPYLSATGHYDEAIRQINGYWGMLYDKDKRLLSHIWDDGAQKFIRQAFWGVGNGWTVAGLARVIDHLPGKMASSRAELVEKATTLIDSLLRYMRPDGLFHDVVDDPSTFVEVNLSQMLAYGIFRGVASGWLPAEKLEQARKMQAAARSKVDRFGLVQDVCGAPHFDKPGVAPEGNAFHLLMEAAAARCEGK